MARLDDFLKQLEDCIEKAVKAKVLTEAIKGVPVHPVLISLKVGRTAGNSFLLAKKGRIRSAAFFASTTSSGLYSASLVCVLASNLVVYINCKNFAPLLVGFSLAVETFAEKIEKMGNSTV